MSVLRKQIRHKVQEVLMDKTIAGPRVFVNRHVKIEGKELPIIVIFANDEPREEFLQSPYLSQRTMNLSIEIMVDGIDDEDDENYKNLDDQIDEQCQKIEDALYGSEELYQMVASFHVVRNSFGSAVDGARLINVVKIEVEIKYQTDPYAAKIADEYFKELSSKFDIDGDQVPEVEDIIPISTT